MAATILDQLAEHARRRVAEARELRPPVAVREAAEALAAEGARDFPFERALKKPGVSFICECKRASPSMGLIAPDFPCLDIARDYEAAGADALSILTEPKWFLGNDEYLREAAAAVSLPCLRKDFTVDEYMIYEAKLLGAAAVLLICSLRDRDTMKRYIETADSLGLSALVEAHDEAEMEAALAAGARIVGVNNRNLKDFTVDVGNSRRLRELAPPSVLFVAESGISTAKEVEALREAGVDAVLVGTALMTAPDRRRALAQLKGASIQ